MSDIDIKDNESRTLLFVACLNGPNSLSSNGGEQAERIAVIKRLLAAGADPKEISRDLYRVLSSEIKDLLKLENYYSDSDSFGEISSDDEKSFEPDKMKEAERTKSHKVDDENGSEQKSFDSLLDKKTKRNMNNAEHALLGNTRTFATFTSAVETKELLLVKSIVKKEILKEARFSINQPNENKSTVLHKACAQNGGSLEIVILLIENNANPCLKNKYGQTPFSLACYWGYYDIVAYLLPRMNDLNIPDNEGDTPLINACRSEQPQIVELLLKNGAFAEKVTPEIMGLLKPEIRILFQKFEEKDKKVPHKRVLAREKQIGIWAGVYMLIIDETVPDLTESKVYETLGFDRSKSRTAKNLLSGSLMVSGPDNASDDFKKIYRKLMQVFHEDMFTEIRCKPKARVVSNMLIQAYRELELKKSPEV